MVRQLLFQLRRVERLFEKSSFDSCLDHVGLRDLAMLRQQPAALLETLRLGQHIAIHLHQMVCQQQPVI